MKHVLRIILAAFAVLALCFVFALSWHRESVAVENTLKIAVPYEEALFHINDSDYVAWLSEQIGQPIEFVFLQANYTDGYLKQILTDANTEYDAVFFTPSTAPTTEEMSAYIATGGIATLDAWIDESSIYLAETLATFDTYDLRQEITYEDGCIYYMPALDASSVDKFAQTLWVNIDLLEEVGLTLPSTTEEFAEMLAAFAAYNPEMAPIIGTTEASSNFSLTFLMNSFVTCDVQNHFLYLDGEVIAFAPSSDAWRAGLNYCSALYADGLLVDENFTYSTDAFVALCNDPDNLVGCFVTDSIANVLSENSPALLSKYLSVAPLDSGTADPVAIISTPLPSVGGIVLVASDQQDAVFALMDLMCSEDGYLRGHYGTPEIDWTAAAPEDITVNGDSAMITVTQSIDGTGNSYIIGPYIASATYADMEAWKGYQINESAYLDARAYRTYAYYTADSTLPYLQLSSVMAASNAVDLDALDAFVIGAMLAFVTGEWDVTDDAAWQDYIAALEGYQIDALLQEAQQLYEESE